MSIDARPAPGGGAADSAAASLINAVSSLVESLVDDSGLPHGHIAEAMGVTPARVSQLLGSDGNLRIASLGRLAEACGSTLTLTATLRSDGASITVPRPAARARRTGARVVPPPVSPAVDDSAESGQERTSLAAAALINAVGALMEEVVGHSVVTRSDLAARLGVTRGRVTQLLDGDGNVRVSTLARVMDAAGADLRLTATRRRDGATVTVPRGVTRIRPVRARKRGDLSGASRQEVATRQQPEQPAPEVAARVRTLVPVRELVQRGILPSETAAHPHAVCDLLGITDLWDEPPFLAAARRHNTTEPATHHQRAWLACARGQSRSLDVPRLDEGALRSLAEGLTRDLADPAAWGALPGRFAEVGVRLIHVEQFRGGKVSGVAFRLDDADPAVTIALSGRGQRLDKVLFTLLHECAHVVLGHTRDGEVILDTDPDAGGEREKAADALAASWALPEPLDVPDLVTPEWVQAEAARRGVHPIVVVGRLQSTGDLSWSSPLGRGAPRVTEYLRSWSASSAGTPLDPSSDQGHTSSTRTLRA